MTRLITCLAVVVLAFGSDPDNPASDADIGTWYVGSLLFNNQFAIGQGLTRAQARAQLGSTLVITKNGIKRLGKKACDEGRRVAIVEMSTLLQSDKLVPPQDVNLKLGLPEQVTVFNYGCMELWLKADGHMVASVDSYYFELTRSRSSASSANALHSKKR